MTSDNENDGNENDLLGLLFGGWGWELYKKVGLRVIAGKMEICFFFFFNFRFMVPCIMIHCQ
jgi:hypothetical protein